MMSTGAFAPCLGPVLLQSQPRSARAMVRTYYITIYDITTSVWYGGADWISSAVAVFGVCGYENFCESCS